MAGSGDAQTEVEALAHRAAGGRASGVRIADGVVTVALDVAGLDETDRAALGHDVVAAVRTHGAVRDVRVAMVAGRQARTLIAVASGKGGVGKSTLATNLALGLAALGRRVGVVDADIYGPSQPRLLDADGTRPAAHDGKLVPVMSPHGIPLLSMGMLAEAGQAVAWRGPMAGKALDQLIDAHWGAAGTLIVDMPPGTGDIQISMLQKHRPTAALIVSTPQDIALIDAARAITLFRDAGVPIIGMVENMAGYACPSCGEVSDPFGRGGAEAEAAALGLPFLGRVPLDRAIRLGGDAGVPAVAQGTAMAGHFTAIATQVERWLNDHKG